MAVATVNPVTGQPVNPNLVAQPFLPTTALAPEAAAAINPDTGVPDSVAATTSVPTQGAPGQAPGAFAGYNPNSTTPYDPDGSLAKVSAIPSAAEGLPQEEPIRNLGAVNHAGAAAYLGDKLFRGYLQGKAIHDARTAIQLQKTTQGLNDNYHTAAENYYTLAQHGADPNSPEMIKATDQVNAAYQAQKDFLSQHVQAMKTNKKGEQVPDQGSILQRIFKPTDPAQVAPAILEGMNRVGPAVFHQVAAEGYNAPEYRQRIQQQQQAAQTGAQTGQIIAQNTQDLAQTKQQYDQLAGRTNLTPEEETQKQQLYNKITQNPATAGGAPLPGVHWLPIPGQKAYKDPTTGNYLMPVRNSVNGTVMTRPMPAGFVPTPTNATEGKEAFSVDPVTHKPYAALYDKVTGQEIPGSRDDNRLPPANVLPRLNSSSHTDANGVTTTNSSSSRPDLSAVGGPHTPGSPQAASAQNATAVATAAPNGGVVPHGTTLASHPGAGTPAAATSLPPGVPKTAAPVTSAPAVAPTTQDWPKADSNPTVDSGIKTWAYRLNTGQTKDTSVPASLRTRVMDYMRQNNIATVLPETAAQNNSQEAMRDMIPALDSAIAALEPHKGEGGVWDGLKQRFSYKEYQAGVNPGDSAAALNQALGFIKVAGTAPWTKIGRGVQIMKTIQEHLPNPSVDAPGLAYEKLVDLKALLKQQEAAVAQRHNMPAPGTPGAPHGMNPSVTGVPGAQPGQANMTLPGTQPAAAVVDLDRAMKLPFNQGKTREQVRADVISHGNKIKGEQ
jgi:hypothetical protein